MKANNKLLKQAKESSEDFVNTNFSEVLTLNYYRW